MRCNAQNYSVFLLIMPKDTKICWLSYVVFLLSLVLKCRGLYGVFPSKRYCIECSIRGQDLTPVWTLLMRWNRRQREAPRPWGGCRGGMLLTLTDEASETAILSRYRPWWGKRIHRVHLHPPGAQSARRPGLNWYIFPHYSRRPLLRVPPARRPSEGERRLRGTEVKGRMSPALSSPSPLIWLGLQSSIRKPCLEAPNACVWTKGNMQCIISGCMMPESLANKV